MAGVRHDCVSCCVQTHIIPSDNRPIGGDSTSRNFPIPVSGCNKYAETIVAADDVSLIHIERIIAAVSSNPRALCPETNNDTRITWNRNHPSHIRADVISGNDGAIRINSFHVNSPGVAGDDISLEFVADAIAICTKSSIVGTAINNNSVSSIANGCISSGAQSDQIAGKHVVVCALFPNPDAISIVPRDHISLKLIPDSISVCTDEITVSSANHMNTRTRVPQVQHPGDIGANVVANHNIIVGGGSSDEDSITGVSTDDVSINRRDSTDDVVTCSRINQNSEQAVANRCTSNCVGADEIPSNLMLIGANTSDPNPGIVVSRDDIVANHTLRCGSGRCHTSKTGCSTDIDSGESVAEIQAAGDVRSNPVALYCRARCCTTDNGDPTLAVSRNEVSLASGRTADGRIGRSIHKYSPSTICLGGCSTRIQAHEITLERVVQGCCAADIDAHSEEAINSQACYQATAASDG